MIGAQQCGDVAVNRRWPDVRAAGQWAAGPPIRTDCAFASIDDGTPNG